MVQRKSITMKPDEKQFDIGLYTFKRRVMGLLCPEDEKQMKDGQIIALLHPIQNVDPTGLYCFGVDKESGDTKTLCRKNLRFSKIITLRVEIEKSMSAHEIVWAKLNASLAYLKRKPKQLALRN